MIRRAALAAIAVVIIGLAGCHDEPNNPTIPGRTAGVLVPHDGLLTGAYVNPADLGFTDQGRRAAVERYEERLGQQLHITHDFIPPFQNLSQFVARANRNLDEGRIPMLSWRISHDIGAYLDPANDQRIREAARAAKQIDGAFFLRFHHEPDLIRYRNQFGYSPADAVAAWRRVRTIWREENAHNAVWVWNLAGMSPGEEAWYPGDDWVDWIGVDPYYFCERTPRNMAQVIGPTFRAFSDSTEKPVMLGEWGVHRYPTQTRVDFVDSLNSLADGWPQLAAVVYFESDSDGCQWRALDSPPVLDAIADIRTDHPTG